ncbi:DUF4249 domain-containing protein [uncultured Tenacibaculum sp.]|uniref:DUF4249 domain-containing protein n=1 Tax=uncultured Tenacibaculum sp. TaxID=174713 RepID=UPI0026039F3E|nr:DUF4249 domain-containing protein [uncultured Tenacibaculum sp.]
MKKHFIYFLIIIQVVTSCIQPLEIDDITFEENIVVKAILTNELKNHDILLSKTIHIDSTGTNPVENATVYITDDTGITYNFRENMSGTYTSNVQFAAEPLKNYTLHIETSSGLKYSSTAEQLPPISEIDKLDFDIELNDDGRESLVIKANSILNSGDGGYYRYSYDETYKVKATYWSPKTIKIVSTNPYNFSLVDKDPNIYGVGFCYGNEKAKKIMVTETKTLGEDRVLAFPLRTIVLDSYIIGIRYSILVNQYVLNKNTYDYYELLSKFSDPDNIFSQVQLGNIPSNITSETNPSENKVSGFFEVSSVYTERFYMNREDITDTSFINYVRTSSCQETVNPALEDQFGGSPLFNFLNGNGYIFFMEDPNNPQSTTRPYFLIGRTCGDCTSVGPPIAPSFWVD